MALIARTPGTRYSSLAGPRRMIFKAVTGPSFETWWAVLSPAPRVVRPKPLLTHARTPAYDTPLGPVWIDREALDELGQALATQRVGITPVAHDQEHALEIELPFLQCALKGEFKLLPLMLRSQAAACAQGRGQALAKVWRGRNALLVASTDLSHFYPEPVGQRP